MTKARPSEPVTAPAQAQQWSEIRAHERSEANLPALGTVLALLVIGAFVMHAALWWWVNASGPAAIDEASRWQAMREKRAPGSQTGFPQLQVSPQSDLQEFLAREERVLRGDGSFEQTNERARIPIERAMEIVAARGGRPSSVETPSGNRTSPMQLQQRRATRAGEGVR